MLPSSAPAAFPRIPSGRGQFPRLQLRGSAGLAPASLSSPSGKDARSEQACKEQKQQCEESNGWSEGSQSLRLSSPSSDEVKYEREQQTQQQRRRQRKVKCRVFSAVNNVPRQPSQGQVGPAKQNQDSSSRKQEDSEDDQKFAQIGHCAGAFVASKFFLRF